MRKQLGRVVSGTIGTAALVGTLLVGGTAATAQTAAVPWSSAVFSGYANGSEIHVGAVTAGTTQLANIEQGFSGASTNSAGLTSPIKAETTAIVQPPQAGTVKAYGTGSGLEVGLGTSTTATTDTNQINVAGRAEAIAPPNSAEVLKQVGPVNVSPVISAGALIGRADAIFDPTQCPIGQPISFGLGDAANANLLSLPAPATGPVLNTAGNGTSVAQSSSYTYLSNNGDGTFGLSTTAADVIAPITANILGVAQVIVAVHTAGGVDAPVTLTAKTTGGASGATVTLSTNDLLDVSIVANNATTPIVSIPLSAVGAGGLHIPLSTAGLSTALTSLTGAAAGVANTIPGAGSALSGVISSLGPSLGTVGSTASALLSNVATVSLGSIDVDTTPHAIGGSVTSSPTIVGGTAASGAIDLLHLNLALNATPAGGAPLPGINLADLFVGHLETAANLNAPISCGIPVIKTANPTSVTAGQPFTYNIQVPDPAKAALLACDLTNVTVTDTITDNTGNPTFSVTSATVVPNGPAGTINQTSPTSATVTWTGLSWKAGQAPITIAINVNVPQNSPAGVIQDKVVATGTAANCSGGTSGIANVGGANGAALTGEFTLVAPQVAAASAAAAGATSPAAAAPPKLPFTGGPGGLWQPIGGVALLGAGGGSLALVRRLRRRSAL